MGSCKHNSDFSKPKSPMKIIEALQWRYATKKFDPEKVVGDETVTALLEAANLTATSYGLQPFKFVVIQNQKLQDQLITSSYGQRQVADASHVIVIASRTDVDPDYISEYVDLVESERGLGEGSMDQYKEVMTGAITGMSDETRQNWAAKQAYIALGTLLAACAALGVDACPMEGFVPNEYNEILGLSKLKLDATVVVPIGYRADDDQTQEQKKVRRPLSDMVIEL
jgi:nitroreductase/dihydropteridine reductase